MTFPLKVDSLHVDDGISAFAASRDGRLIAIGTVGMVGVYQVKESGSMCHLGSFPTPRDSVKVTHAAFNKTSNMLIIRTDDGVTRELSVRRKHRGILQELKRTDDV